jgi:hypothetical protein
MNGIVLHPASAADLDLLAQGFAPPGAGLPEGGIETPEILAMLRDLAATISPDF